MQTISPSSILALDVGASRIGVASANLIAQLPQPLTTIRNEGDVAAAIAELVHKERAGGVVVGLPRGLQGQDTAQTAEVRQFVARIKPQLAVPLYWQDEALTSKKAEAELQARGRRYEKADIDALSATYILEDFLRDNPGGF